MFYLSLVVHINVYDTQQKTHKNCYRRIFRRKSNLIFIQQWFVYVPSEALCARVSVLWQYYCHIKKYFPICIVYVGITWLYFWRYNYQIQFNMYWSFISWAFGKMLRFYTYSEICFVARTIWESRWTFVCFNNHHRQLEARKKVCQPLLPKGIGLPRCLGWGGLISSTD